MSVAPPNVAAAAAAASALVRAVSGAWRSLAATLVDSEPYRMRVCTPDPQYPLSAPPLCAETSDYFAFARGETLAPLFVASGAYCAYVGLRLTIGGGYVRASRVLTSALVYVLAWLALAALDACVRSGGGRARMCSATRLSWSPGFALLGAPASVALGVWAGVFADAWACGNGYGYGYGYGYRYGGSRGVRVGARRAFALLALAPLAAVFIGDDGALWAQWAVSAAALLVLWVVASRDASLGVPLGALWLLCAWRYSAHVYVVLGVACAGSIVVSAVWGSIYEI